MPMMLYRMKDATAKMTAGRTGLIQWSVLTAFAFVLAFVVVQAPVQPDRQIADAQGLPPNSGWIIFDGQVTVNGRTPDITGFELVARVGDWESRPVVVGRLPRNPHNFYHLIVNPPHEGHRGEQIEFWIADERSDTTDYYAVLTEQTGEVCFDCPFTFPIRRSVTLDFARIPAPAAAATPSPVPTATDQTANTPTVTPVPTEPPEPTRSPLSVAELLATFTRFILSTCTTIEGMAGFDWLQSECDAIVERLR